MRRVLAFAVIFGLAAVACLDDPEEELTTSQSSTEPMPEWMVTSGNASCDEHLRSSCPRLAFACLSNVGCAALASCYARCGGATAYACFEECERANRPRWQLVDPYVTCAFREPTCFRPPPI